MKEIIFYLLKKKKYWFLPVVIFLMLISFILAYAASTALSPFIYTLF